MNKIQSKGFVGVIVLIVLALILGGAFGYTIDRNGAQSTSNVIDEGSDSVGATATSTTAASIRTQKNLQVDGFAKVNGALQAATTTLSKPLVLTSVNSTSTTATAYTMVEKDLLGYSTIEIVPNINSLTLTLPASSTLTSFIPSPGQRLSIVLVNGTSTAAKTVTIVGGTGTLIKNATTTSAVGPAAASILHFIRKANTDIDVLMNVGI